MLGVFPEIPGTGGLPPVPPVAMADLGVYPQDYTLLSIGGKNVGPKRVLPASSDERKPRVHRPFRAIPRYTHEFAHPARSQTPEKTRIRLVRVPGMFVRLPLTNLK